MRVSVCVFDSGLGGFSVLRAVRALGAGAFAGSELEYLADTAFFPYGDRSEAQIADRVVAVLGAYLARPGAARVVVVACNTASTAALGPLRAAHPGVRFVGVVPAVKPAAAASATGVIGVLATPGTVSRPYSARLIADHAAGCRVYRHGAPHLAQMAERALCGETLPLGVLRAEIAPLFTDPKMDAVVLGCTHYPLLQTALAQAAPWPVHWFDSGEAVARQVLRQWQAETGAETADTPGHTADHTNAWQQDPQQNRPQQNRPEGHAPGTNAALLGSFWSTAPCASSYQSVVRAEGFPRLSTLMVHQGEDCVGGR